MNFRPIYALLLALLAAFLSSCSQPTMRSDKLSASAEVKAEQLSLPSVKHQTEQDQFRCYPVDQSVFNHPIDALPPAFPIAPDENIWPRLQHNLQLAFRQDPRVLEQLQRYQRNPSYFRHIQQRASRYLHYILTELHANNMPADLALLPIVESAYEPFAYSHGQAAGLWQFIPMTADRFKLQRDWWLDERRDVVASTQAAIAYLKYLHRFFDGDWELAIAAYNAGEGTVRKAIRKNRAAGKATDFWHLQLPKETSQYVPKMIALSHIFKQPESFGISLEPIANRAYFDSVTVEQQLDLSQAAKLAGIDIEELYHLNPGLNRWATPPSTRYQLQLPITQIARFQQQLAQLPNSAFVQWQRYKVQSGDSLSTIAKRHNSQVVAIKSANQLQTNMIKIGQILLIPSAISESSQYALSQDQRLQSKQSRRSTGDKQRISYRVKPGDSFWSIAKQYQISVQSLARWNGKSPKDTLQINETLVIWQARSANLSQRSDNVQKVFYRVRQGDSLSSIASKFNLATKQISHWNQLNREDYLYPGQNLKLLINVMDTYQ